MALKLLLVTIFGLYATAVPTVSEQSILILGDWGNPNNLGPLSQVATAMDKIATDTSAISVITVGDNFYEDGVESANDNKWNSVWLNIFKGRTASLTWNALMGNHDWYGNSRAELDYSRKNPRWNQPGFFYTQETTIGRSKVAYVFIETSLLQYGYSGSSTAQRKPRLVKNFIAEGWTANSGAIENHLQVIEGYLQRFQNYEHLFVFGHHDLQTCSDQNNAGMLKLDSLLQKYRVSAYVFGHRHALQSTKAGSTLYIQSGSGGFQDGVCGGNRGWGASVYGFVNLKISESRFSFDFYDFNSRLIHTDTGVTRK